MDIRKLLTISLLAVCLVGCMTTVNAGLFDFLDGDMEEHDFGNFTMSVPKNTTFNESVQSNGEDSISKLAEKFGGSVHIEYNDSKWMDPDYKSYFHSFWDNGEDDDILFVEYVDYNEDGLSKDNLMSELYPDVDLKDSNADMSTYYMSDFSQYVIVKYNDDKSAVIIRGKNQDSLTQMAESIKFKE